jgi:hypothetical protein
MAFFTVSDAGRRALARHLAALPVQHRAFVVSYEGFDRIVPARTRDQARYLEYLSVSDCFSELKFGDFVKQARVRVAA